MPVPVDRIREAVSQGNYLITRHARMRKGLRKVLDREIVQTVVQGEVVEEYPQARPFPKCLFMYPVRPGEPLYVSCAFDGVQAHIITVHWFDPDRWIDWRTRRGR